jgi:hypothetical protein
VLARGGRRPTRIVVINQYFNTSPFALNTLGTFCSAPRNLLSGASAASPAAAR